MKAVADEMPQIIDELREAQRFAALSLAIDSVTRRQKFEISAWTFRLHHQFWEEKRRVTPQDVSRIPRSSVDSSVRLSARSWSRWFTKKSSTGLGIG